MFLLGLTSFEAWILLIIFSLIPTICIYWLLSRVQENSAFLQGNIGGVVVKLGGPVAFYAILLWLGNTSIPPHEKVALLVTLEQPEEEQAGLLDLVSGEYKYDERTNSGDIKSYKGQAELTLGPGGWQVMLPHEALNWPIALTFKDRSNQWWAVRPFYPRNNKQPLVKTSHPSQSRSMPFFERTLVRNAFAATGELPAFQLASDKRTLYRESKEVSLKFENYARPVESGSQPGRPYYQWRVFLNEPRAVLDTIAEVEYLLHPTFPNPLQVRVDPNTKFALETWGWGQFTIFITIRYKDGRIEKTSYDVNLSKDWPE